jgi:hypothetical protein
MIEKRHIVHPINSSKCTNEWDSVSYCGAELSLMDMYFQDASHAILAIEQRSLIEPCEKCLKRIKEILG